MKLTNETVKGIKVGDVVRFSWLDAVGITLSLTGVVYSNDEKGIKCNREKFAPFTFDSKSFNGTIEFTVLEEHPPVAKFNGTFDYVCKHM